MQFRFIALLGVALVGEACTPAPSVVFWPDGPFIAPVGDRLLLALGVSPDQLPSLSVVGSPTASVDVRGSDWNLCVSDVQFTRPGPVHLVAQLMGAKAEALVAGYDPKTVSTPVALPSGLSSSLLGKTAQARLFTDSPSWRTFAETLQASGSALPQDPPIDFSRWSLVAVVSNSSKDTEDPLVTSVDDASPAQKVTVVVPQVLNPGLDTDEHGTTAITLLRIGKVTASATVDFVTLGSH